MATSWCLCQPWGILSGRNTSGITAGICLASKRIRPLEWSCGWCYCSIYHAFIDHKSNKLGKTGSLHELLTENMAKNVLRY